MKAAIREEKSGMADTRAGADTATGASRIEKADPVPRRQGKSHPWKHKLKSYLVWVTNFDA